MTRPTDDLAAVLLAAGAGMRLRPLTNLKPKALCPVDNVPLVDRAIEWASRVTNAVAVNVHNGRAMMEKHLAGRVVLSIEEPRILGTAGALGALREWIGGRHVLVLNADAYHEDGLKTLTEGWSGETIRLLAQDQGTASDFDTRRYVGAALIPWNVVRAFEPAPSGLFDECFRPRWERGELELVDSDAPFIDCGTVGGYHAANMAASGGKNVVGEGAVVEGFIERTVVWPGARVHRGERLRDAIRAGDLTLYAS
jgi:NDP-sugar pyrophosphorylase family protein